jgi:hypothetical protein
VRRKKVCHDSAVFSDRRKTMACDLILTRTPVACQASISLVGVMEIESISRSAVGEKKGNKTGSK